MSDAVSRPLIHPAYFTDEYPREGLTLVIDLQADGAAMMAVYHPGKTTPLETYFCDDDAVLQRRVAEWLVRHPSKAKT